MVMYRDCTRTDRAGGATGSQVPLFLIRIEKGPFLFSLVLKKTGKSTKIDVLEPQNCKIFFAHNQGGSSHGEITKFYLHAKFFL